jgi:selenocysteine lyase/cysteine desulfurase
MDWSRVRAEFPVTERWVFLDHAAVAPLSAPARRALIDYADEAAAHGVVAEPRWLQRIEATRGLFGRLLNADPQQIAFIKNTSEGIGFVAEGFPWRAGDNVVLAAEEYPANIYPWMNLAGRGVEVRLVPTRDQRIWVDDIRAALDARTRVVSLSFVEYASGFRNDLDAVGALCRERGVYFCVDAIQGLGVFPLDVQTTPVDFLAADGHKWLLGPDGAGIFYLRPELVDFLHPVSVGWHSVVGAWDFATIAFHLKPHAGRWEGGSFNAAGIAALGASLELLLRLGIETVRDRVLALTDYLCERLAQIGLEVYSSRRPEDKSGIVSVSAPGRDLRAIVRRCRAQGVVINQRAGRLRISPHCYNTPEEIDRLIEVLQQNGD